MMKKISALLMAMIMCVSLVACGGVDKQPAIDAFNNASTAYDQLVDKVNAEIERYPQELIDVMNEMAAAMMENKEILESDQELTEEDVALMIEAFAEVEQWAKETDAQLEELAIQYVDKQLVIDAFNSTSTVFDEMVNKINANIEAYPQDVIDLMTQMSAALTQCKELLESDQQLTEELANELITQLGDIEAWVAEAEAVLLEDADNAGGVDKQAAIDAFNYVSSMFDATANAINANIEAYPQEFIDAMIEMADLLSQYKEVLESDYEFTQEELDEMLETFALIEQWVLEVESQVFG